MPKNPTYSRQGSSIGPTRDTTIDDNNPRQGNNLSDGAVNNPTMQDYYDTVQRGYHWWDTIFNPQKVQDYEFAQGMIAADMQNQYNSETAKLARGRAAGISSSAMAAGIAGAGGSEMQQVSAGTPPPLSNPIAAAADVAGAVQGFVGAGTDIAGTASQISLNRSTEKVNDSVVGLNRANQTYIEQKSKIEPLVSAGEFVKGLTLTGDWELNALTAILPLFGDSYDGVKQVVSNVNACRHMTIIDDQINADIALKDKEFEQKEKDIRLMESQIGINEVNRSLLEVKKEREQYLRDIDKLRKQRSEDAGIPVGEAAFDALYMLFRESKGDYEKFMAGFRRIAFEGSAGTNLGQTLFGQVNNAYAAAQQLTAQALNGIKQWISSSEPEPNRDSGVYRENRSYNYDNMLDVFLPLVNSKRGEGAVESALSDMMSQYGYSKDDVMKFFNEWSKGSSIR